MEEVILFPQEPSIFRPEEIDRLFLFAYENKASEISICTGERVVISIHDINFEVTRRVMSEGDLTIIVNHLYGANGATQISMGKDIDGAYAVQKGKSEFVRFRYNATACQSKSRTGAEISVRPIDSKPRSLDQLGVEEIIRLNYLHDDGMVAVCGPTGSGKSTLLAAIIRDILEKKDLSKKILTYESPIEYVYDEIERYRSIIRQHEIPKHLPTFDQAIRNSLRRAPDIIVVGECRDQLTIQAALEASETGHQIFTTIHTNSVPHSVYRMVNFFKPEERNTKQSEIVDMLRMIVVQRLVPKLGGGRVAMKEILVFTEEMRDRLRHCESSRELVSQIKSFVDSHGVSMLASAYRLRDEGLIDNRELDKVEVMSKGGISIDPEKLF